MIKEALLGKLIDEGINQVKKILKEKGASLSVKKEDIHNSLFDHINYINNWSKEIAFRDFKRAKSLDDLYLDINIQLNPRKYSAPDEAKETSTILEIISKEKNHPIILGDPGAGKTTSLKFIARKFLTDDVPELKDYGFPIFIPLRTLKWKETIYDRLKKIIGIEISFDKKNSIDLEVITKRITNRYLKELNALILLDGLDEVTDNFYEVVDEIRELMLNLNLSKVILTCRSGAYNFNIENSVVFELCPLKEKQIKEFASKWFKNDGTTEMFMIQLLKSPYYDTSIRPLTLAQLCALYDKYFKIPDRPKSVYKRIIRLLIEEWDIQRGINRTSIYNDFETDRKIEFLSMFAYQLTQMYSNKRYTTSEFWQVYEFIRDRFSLPSEEKEKIISEIEAHNGLIIQSSYDTYEFTHKSLQEYLAANYIIGLVEIPEYIKFSNFKDELAIALALSSEPHEYFAKLVFTRFKTYKPDGNDIIEFLRRIYIEKPEFEKSPLFPICLYFLLYEYQIDENIFHSLLYDFIKINNFKESIILIEDYYEVEHKKEKRYKEEVENTYFYKFADVPCKVRESLPAKFKVPKRLYTELIK